MFKSPLYPVRSPSAIEMLVFSFFPNGATAGFIAQASLAGYVVSVNRTGVGRFDAIVPDIGILVGMEANLRNGGGAVIDVIALVFAYVAATRTISIALQDINTGAATNAAADVPADPNAQVLVKMFFQPTVTQ